MVKNKKNKKTPSINRCNNIVNSRMLYWDCLKYGCVKCYCISEASLPNTLLFMAVCI